MKIYAFVRHAASDGEFLGVNVSLYTSKKDALKAFNEWKEDELPYVNRDGWVIDPDDKEHFEAFLQGFYASDHTEGYIEEHEI